ncbi:MAG: S8 family serine peptidase [Ilumatobacteraceae bacterium]
MRLRALLSAGLGGALLIPASAVSATPSDHASVRHVIVIAEAGRLGETVQRAAALGGEIERTLALVNGFSLTISDDRLDDLLATGMVRSATPDVAMKAMAVDPVLGYDPASTSSLAAVSQITGASSMWSAGYTGKGVDVAVIDTGVTTVTGLNGAGKVVNGPDISFDSIEPTLVSRDAFGHGTHIAGIIAGNDVTATCSKCGTPASYLDPTKFVGIAPDARIINVKVGAFDGAADVSQVIAGIDWVVQHRKDTGFNIRVINLSFGTDSGQSLALDPLVHAAEMAWKSGVVVVAAAGNDGLLTTSLADPAMSPLVIAVGASDPRGTVDTTNDTIPLWAQHGSAARAVDLVAPGVSMISLRVPGGFVDSNVTTGKVGTRFQQASGTSQSTAVVSGLVALLLSKFPTATPDQVKSYLKANAQPLTLIAYSGKIASAINNWYSGAGSASVRAAATLASLPAAPSATGGSSGSGTLEGSRGSYHVGGTVPLAGEKDIFGKAWVPSTMSAATTSCTTWSLGIWNGARWTGDKWTGGSWVNVTWTDNDWTGARWSGARWSSTVWDGARWSGARWSGARWSSGTWSGARWSGARWSDYGWA